jgi:23S rRNA (cytidine1920-2'-O)/16S rRNA (cytidine1409-2'-O)-methyltransferase
VGKGGVLRDETLRRRVIADTVNALTGLGLACRGVTDSAVPGTEGNREAFALFALPRMEEAA